MGPDPNASNTNGQSWPQDQTDELVRRHNEKRAHEDAERFCRELEPILAVFLERRDTTLHDPQQPK
jgi:hypothetical protein